ncbi:hypothetical protein [Roseobacter cerasinus]|uniref:hypothetical protein n=1 Tax=Roseobacter cerasinus TaxID=2602289 RepID=UPI00135AC522|nr:hypothetical protein [Roseobacter cerasinus]
MGLPLLIFPTFMICDPYRSVTIVDEQAHVVAVTCHSNVGEVPIHSAGGKDVGLINGCALGFVDGDSVAMIKGAEAAWIKMDKAVGVSVELYGNFAALGFHDRSQHPVFHTDVFVIARKDDAVVSGESAFAGVCGEQGFRWRIIT